MDADILFVRTLADLDRRTKTNDEYEALLCGGLLRKLLLDGQSLTEQVNGCRRVPIRFGYNGISAYERQIFADKPYAWMIGDMIDPDTIKLPGLSLPAEAPLADFLARPVMFFRGTPITVKDLIRQLAHIDGAVHKGKPKDAREELIDQVQRFIFVNDLPGGVRQVQLIAKIVVRGLSPLRESVLADCPAMGAAT